MAIRHFFKSSGNTLIPVSDAEFFTDEMDAGHETGNCFIVFYSDEGITPVTPTNGTVDFYIDPFGEGQWHESVDGQIDATTVTVDPAAYTPPAFDTCAVRSKVKLTGITGATHFKAFHWRT